MAFVSDVYGLESPRSFSIPSPFRFKGVFRLATMATGAIVIGGCMIAALGMVEAVLPAFMPLAPVMRRMPAAIPHQLTVVDQGIGVGQVIRRRFIEAYTADNSYSNMDWRRNKSQNSDIVADVGPEAVIEETDVLAKQVVEPREERVMPLAQVQFVLPPQVIATATSAAQSAFLALRARDDDTASRVQIVPVPSNPPAVKNLAPLVEDETAFVLPEVAPFPGRKPKTLTAENQKQPKLTYAPQDGQTEDIQRGLVQRLFGHTARNKTAIYDISAATVYLPNGEKLEAHSGIGYMRDNPKFVNQKMRGATPPSTYNLRMRESLFHGVEAVRLLPADGRNPHNRDGLLAHTYMLRRPGDSNGCVVFKDYARFLRAFKRGEVNKIIVVESSSSFSNKKYM